MNVSVDELFEEFVERWALGSSTDLEVLLERAGPARDELARVVDAFLARAPRREPSEESKQAIAELAARLEHEPPLLTARVSARRRVRDVVQLILVACELPAQAESLVQSYYQRLEGGLLDPRGVSERIWAVLEDAVAPAARKRALDGYAPSPAAAPAVAFQRVADADFPAPVALEPAEAGLPDDVRRRVDALFISAPVD